MSYVRVDSSVRTNIKFLKAGPAASWLWLCGNAYCQETLTDGFIPFEALRYLGVAQPKPLIPKLVKAKLWDVVEGGWKVHDYLQHNKSAEEIQRIKHERANGGKQGGRKPSAHQEGKPSRLTSSETFPVDVDVDDVVAVDVKREESARETHDGGFWAFKAAYPASRRSGGMSERLYFEAIQSGKVTHAAMMAALENHKASEQWQEHRHIPNMQKWLEEERWDRVLPPPKALGTSSKTAGNAEAIRQFVERHRDIN